MKKSLTSLSPPKNFDSYNILLISNEEDLTKSFLKSMANLFGETTRAYNEKVYTCFPIILERYSINFYFLNKFTKQEYLNLEFKSLLDGIIPKNYTTKEKVIRIDGCIIFFKLKIFFFVLL